MNTTVLQVSPGPSLVEVNRYLDATIGSGKKVVADDFVHFMRERSAAHHAATGRPLRRMSYPGALARKGTEADGRNAVLVYTGREGLMVSAPGMAPERATGRSVRPLAGSASYIVVALDRSAAASLESVCNRNESTLDLAATVEVQRHMEISSRLMLLDQALARTFWAPESDETSPMTISKWCALLGVSDDPSGWRSLAGACMYDPTRDVSERRYSAFVHSILASEDAMESSLGKRTSVNGARLFAIQSSIGEAWSAVERIDPLLRPIHIASGEVVELTGARWNDGGAVEARVSIPCRLRANSGVIICHENGSIADTTLVGMNHRGHLIGVFATRSSGGRARSGQRAQPGAAVQALNDIVDSKGRVYVTGAPFLGASAPTSVLRWSKNRGSGLPALEPLQIPVDVAIAGAPDA